MKSLPFSIVALAPFPGVPVDANHPVFAGPLDCDDLDEQIYARIYSIEALNGFLDSQYQSFVGSIYGRKWKTRGYQQFQEWLHQD